MLLLSTLILPAMVSAQIRPFIPFCTYTTSDLAFSYDLREYYWGMENKQLDFSGEFQHSGTNYSAILAICGSTNSKDINCGTNSSMCSIDPANDTAVLALWPDQGNPLTGWSLLGFP